MTNRNGAVAAHTDRKVYGDEPSWSTGQVLTTVDEIHTYNWYSYMQGPGHARDYLASYLKDRPDDAKMLNRIPDWAVPLTAAWIVRIIARGGSFTSDKRQFVEDKLNEAFQYVRRYEPETVIPLRPNVQARIRNKAGDFIADIEAELDARNFTFNVYDYLTANNVSSRVAQEIRDYYVPLRDEVELVVTRKDKDLVEAYRHLKRPELNALYTFVSTILDSAEKFADNKKVVRKPRKRKEKSADKILQHFKPLKEHPPLQLVSVNPVAVLGAQELWLYNVTYGILTVLRASGPKGLSVHRTAIVNFDPASSESKRIGRKAPEFLAALSKATKTQRKKFMTTIKTSALPKVKDRVGDDTLVLFAFK